MDASPELSPEIVREAPNVIEEMVVDQILNITSPPEDFSVEEKSLSCLSNPPSFIMAADSTRLDNVVQGSPGSTPFPRVHNKWQQTVQDLDGSYIFADPRLDISDSINGSPLRNEKRSKLEISLELPQAPPNTPNAKNLEEEIINIAKREEEKLQLQMKIKGLQNLSEPKPEVEEVENIATNANESNLEHAPIIASPSERETNRRQRMVNGVTKLKALIPGLTPQSNDMEVLEKTHRYIEFLRRFVDEKHDEMFLQNQIL